MIEAGPERPDEISIARAVADAVRQVPGVAAISAPGVVAATYGVGTVVPGVAVSHTAGGLMVEVHVTAVYRSDLNLPELAQRVRQATERALAYLDIESIGRVDVVIDDLKVGSLSR